MQPSTDCPLSSRQMRWCAFRCEVQELQTTFDELQQRTSRLIRQRNEKASCDGREEQAAESVAEGRSTGAYLSSRKIGVR